MLDSILQMTGCYNTGRYSEFVDAVKHLRVDALAEENYEKTRNAQNDT